VSRTIYLEKECHQEEESSEQKEILHFKQLIVTMKQHYEKIVHDRDHLLKQEKIQKIELEKLASQRIAQMQKMHEEELVSLQSQILSLKEFIQKNRPQIEKCQETDLSAKQKSYLQDKYEQLKEEWSELSAQLDETVEARNHLQKQLLEKESALTIKDETLSNLDKLLTLTNQEKEALEVEFTQLRSLIEDSEMQLKVAQLHLAKKVKESTLQEEKIHEQQAQLEEIRQFSETQKEQIINLLAKLENIEKQERKLQDQLHDALKGTESQAKKWEEKYFQIYDKWQASQAQNQELKKLEEKQAKIETLLFSLNHLMGYQPNQEFLVTDLPKKPDEETACQLDFFEGRYDLFGMLQNEKQP
jgi:hypothetical protein